MEDRNLSFCVLYSIFDALLGVPLTWANDPLYNKSIHLNFFKNIQGHLFFST